MIRAMAWKFAAITHGTYQKWFLAFDATNNNHGGIVIAWVSPGLH